MTGSSFLDRLRDRPIAKSLTNTWHSDPPMTIAKAFGRDWFYDTEARAIHRIGIFLGLGWRLPKYVQRPDGIDMVCITAETVGFGTPETYTIKFLHCGDRPPEEAEEVRKAHHIPLDLLREAYEEMLHHG